MATQLTTEQLAHELEQSLLDRYGPMLPSRVLWKVLGYPSPEAWRQALVRQALPVPVFGIEGRRGRFALARDVAHWIAEQRMQPLELSEPKGD